MNKNVCENCDQPIRIQIHKGTGICSENCRKELERRRAVTRAHLDSHRTYEAQRVTDSKANTGY